ncbi:MAG: radical SAM protein [Deltaproteobacteria bacterium]|nr:radical SAM protein [Deltaproteobacteria bacterium]
MTRIATATRPSAQNEADRLLAKTTAFLKWLGQYEPPHDGSETHRPVTIALASRTPGSPPEAAPRQGAARRRPVEDIVDEVRTLKARADLTDDKVLVFTDDTLVASADTGRPVQDTIYLKKLFEALIPLDILWTGRSALNVADDMELVEIMARSGCVQLLVSFQSISNDNLSTRGKLGNRASRYLQQVDRLQRHGITLMGSLVLGTDEDTPAVFERTAHFIDAAIDIPRLSILTPSPDSSLYQHLKLKGRILHDDTARYDGSHVVFEPKHMSPGQLENGYRWLAKHTFSTAAIFKRTGRAATRSLVYQHPRMMIRSRLASILASNLIYRDETLGIDHDITLESQGTARTSFWEQLLQPEPVGA